jgi:hypothetical protein
MLDSVRSSIIAATFRVNDRPNAKPNPDASSRDGTHTIAEGRGTTPHVYRLIARYFIENLPAGAR